MEKIYALIEKYLSFKDHIWRQTAAGQKIVWFRKKAYVINSRQVEDSLLATFYNHFLFMLVADGIINVICWVRNANPDAALIQSLLWSFIALVFVFGHIYLQVRKILRQCPVLDASPPSFWEGFDRAVANVPNKEWKTYLLFCILALAYDSYVWRNDTLDWLLLFFAIYGTMLSGLALYRLKKQSQ